MFDRYVAQTKPSWKRRGWIIASVALHVGVLFAMMLYMLLHIEEITPPALSLTFFSAAPPPPPPPPPPKASTPHVEHKVTPKVETPKTMVQPTDVKPIVQPKEEEKKEEDDGEEGGEEGGVKGGVAGGVKGGVVGGTVGGTVGASGTGQGQGGAPKTVPQFVLSASKLSAPDPHLPDWFRNQHAGQTLRGTYRVCIRQDGHVSDVYSIAGIPGADAAIIETVKSQWAFKPQGLPVCAPWVFVFKIN